MCGYSLTPILRHIRQKVCIPTPICRALLSTPRDSLYDRNPNDMRRRIMTRFVDKGWNLITEKEEVLLLWSYVSPMVEDQINHPLVPCIGGPIGSTRTTIVPTPGTN